MSNTVHLIAGGYPRGTPAGHDMDYARLQLLELLAERPRVITTVAGDFDGVEGWLGRAGLLITYVAGPFPDEAQSAAIRQWLEAGGRWLGLHGTSGGKAARVPGTQRRAMVRTPHHDVLGGFFINHPPVRRFEVRVAADHPLTRGLPPRFEVADELYLVEMVADNQVLLTTELAEDPSPPGFGFAYERDTSVGDDGVTRVLGFARDIGSGGVAYVALGHCHSPVSNVQPFVDESVAAEGATPLTFRGPWPEAPFRQLLRNGIAWGLGESG